MSIVTGASNRPGLGRRALTWLVAACVALEAPPVHRGEWVTTDHTPTQQQSQEIPYGYCHCGCGQPAPIAKRTRPDKGHVKGFPTRYIVGHWAKHKTKPTIGEAFWAYVAPGDPDDCWEWQGTRNENGYGRFRHNGKKYYAHRFSYEFHNGPISDGLDVLHRCDNPPCENPNHLFLGTQTDNNADMLEKGRQAKGEQQPLAKLTEGDILDIRRLRMQGWTQVNLAEAFGVSQANVSKISRGEAWQHVDAE